jgi:hypothetical protein
MGTPRGSPIGFSREKYTATLLMLAEHRGQKQIAEFLEIGYGLLRKWKTEPEFKKEVEQHVKEFAALFKEYVTSFLRNPNSDISLKELREEVNSFAPQLSMKSLLVLEEIINEGEFFSIYLFELIDVLMDSALKDPRLRSDTLVICRRISQKMIAVLRTKYIDRVIEVLSGPMVSKKDKEDCIRLLRTLRDCTGIRSRATWFSLVWDHQPSSTQIETETYGNGGSGTKTE